MLSCGRSGIEAALVTYPGQIIARLSSAEVVGYQTADLGSIAPAGWARPPSGPAAATTASSTSTLGHNVGAALVIGGKLHRGASGFGGELAHVQVRDDGDLSRCGGRGCLAAIVGSSLLDYVRLSNEEQLALPQMLALAAERDPGVRRVFADLGRLVGRPLASFCTMFDPELLGGPPWPAACVRPPSAAGGRTADRA